MTPRKPPEILMVAVGKLRPSPDNPPERLDPEDPETVALAESIAELGVLQPIRASLDGDEWEIESGHRRWVAAKLAKQTHVPVNPTKADASGIAAARFAENFHRQDLSPIQAARALKSLADTGLSQREIALRASVTQPHVSKLLSLTRLPEGVQGWIDNGEMTLVTGLALASLPKDVLADLIANGRPHQINIQSAVRRVETEKAIEKARKAAEAKGFAVVTEQPQSHEAHRIDGTWAPMFIGTGMLSHVVPEEHEKEPCHGVWIQNNGVVHPVCTEAGNHPAPKAKSQSARARDEDQGSFDGVDPEGEAQAVEHARRISEPDVRRSAIDFAMLPLLEPTKGALDAVDPDAALEWAVRFLFVHGSTGWDDCVETALDLLESDVDRTDSEKMIVDALEAAGIGPIHLLHATALVLGIWHLRHVLDSSYRGIRSSEEDVDAARAFLEHVRGATEEATPVLSWEDPELLVLLGVLHPEALSQSDPSAEDPSSEGPSPVTEEPVDETSQEEPVAHVSLRLSKGNHLRHCSTCGPLEGRNKQLEYAVERSKGHITEKHEGVGTWDEKVA